MGEDFLFSQCRGCRGEQVVRASTRAGNEKARNRLALFGGWGSRASADGQAQRPGDGSNVVRGGLTGLPFLLLSCFSVSMEWPASYPHGHFPRPRHPPGACRATLWLRFSPRIAATSARLWLSGTVALRSSRSAPSRWRSRPGSRWSRHRSSLRPPPAAATPSSSPFPTRPGPAAPRALGAGGGEILIPNPSSAPGGNRRRARVRAALRGVRVRLLL